MQVATGAAIISLLIEVLQAGLKSSSIGSTHPLILLRDEAAFMPNIGDFLTLVKQTLEICGDVCNNEPARRHFAEYLTGLMEPTAKWSVASTANLPSIRINCVSIAS
jgi:hypothetical protein